MRLTASDHAALGLRQRKGDIFALIIQTGDRYRIPLMPTYKTPAAREAIKILGLKEMPATYYPDHKNPLHPTEKIWVFPENVHRYS